MTAYSQMSLEDLFAKREALRAVRNQHANAKAEIAEINEEIDSRTFDYGDF